MEVYVELEVALEKQQEAAAAQVSIRLCGAHSQEAARLGAAAPPPRCTSTAT